MSDRTRPDWMPESAWLLEEHAEEQARLAEKLTGEIERDEAELVRKREARATAARRSAEMRVAANVVRASGLRSETTPTGPLIELPNPPAEKAVA